MPTPSTFRGNTMLYGRVGTIYFVVHSALPPSNADWNDWLRDVEREASSIQGMLVYTEGGGPDARQRKLTADMWERRGTMPSIALVSGSSVIRMIVTAFNYFLSKPIRAFSPNELDEALAVHLKVPPADRVEARRAIFGALAQLQTSKQATL